MCDRSSARQVPVPGSEVLSDPNSLRGKVYIAAAPAWRQLSELATLLLFNLGGHPLNACAGRRSTRRGWLTGPPSAGSFAFDICHAQMPSGAPLLHVTFFGVPTRVALPCAPWALALTIEVPIPVGRKRAIFCCASPAFGHMQCPLLPERFVFIGFRASPTTPHTSPKMFHSAAAMPMIASAIANMLGL